MRRVLVTGVGVSLVGAPHTRDYLNGLPCSLPKEYDCTEQPDFGTLRAEDARHLSRAAARGVVAASLAARSAFSAISMARSYRVGAFVGAPFRYYNSEELGTAARHSMAGNAFDSHLFATKGVGHVRPGWLLSELSNRVLHFVAHRYGACGPHANLQMGSVSSAIALGEGLRCIQRGDADVAFVGGYDDLFSEEAADLLAPRTECSLDAALTPGAFDVARRGCAASSGAAFLVLEEQSHATKRGALPMAEVLGFSSKPKTTSLASPPVDSLSASLKEAGPLQLDCVFANGAGSPEGDRDEAALISGAFAGGRVPPVTALKSSLGHTGAASGVLECAFALVICARGVVPPIVNLVTPDPDCNIPTVIAAVRKTVSTFALNSASQRTGRSVSIVFRVFSQ